MIYEALFDDEALNALPAVLADCAAARSAVIQWRHVDQTHEIMTHSYFTPTFLARYVSEFAAIDPWGIALATKAKSNEVIRLEQYVPPSVYEASRMYRDLIRAQGDDTFHCTGMFVHTPWGEGIVGVHRGRGARAFEAGDVEPLGDCIPHLRRMLQVRGELMAYRRGERVGRDSLDSLALGVVVVQGDGHVVRTNLAADAVLRRADGLVEKGRRLGCVNHASRLRLEAALAAATALASPSASAIAIDRAGRAPAYLASVTPLVGATGRPMAVLLFRDPDTDETSLEPSLRSLFSLTRIEAAIAVDLSKGLGASLIARKRGVKPNTIKSQLASLAAKMGCGRQAEIAARVASLPPLGWVEGIDPGRTKILTDRPNIPTAKPTPKGDRGPGTRY
jgi:DNA-binding CsgD family transcriptional regulator